MGLYGAMLDAKNPMSRILAMAETASLRSDLARWMAENHDSFASMLKTYRPRWVAIAEQLGAEKLLPLPKEFWSDDPTIRQAARKKAGKAAKRVWDRTHAKHKARHAVPGEEQISRSDAIVSKRPAARSAAAPRHPAATDTDLPDDEEEEIEIPTADGTTTHTVRIPKNR
jgi:hypothetical protein